MAFAEQIEQLTDRQREAVRIWQKTDKAYVFAQRIARGDIDIDRLPDDALTSALTFQQAMDDAIDLCRLPSDITLYRGIRHLRRTFSTEDLDRLMGRTIQLEGYCATSVVRRVAIDEFTTPSGALLEIYARRGTSALWVAGVGEQRLRYQGEVLLEDHLQICITGCRDMGALAVLSVEVIA